MGIFKNKSVEEKVAILRKKQNENPDYIMSNQDISLMKKYNQMLFEQKNGEIRKKKKELSKANAQQKTRRKVTTTIPRTTQETIPYLYDYDEGVFEVAPNKYSKAFLISDINYRDAEEKTQENIITKWAEFLNFFSEDIHIQVTIDNRIVSDSEMKNKIFYKATGDNLDIHRQEYNNIMTKALAAGKNNIQQRKYIIITIEANEPIEAIIRFRRLSKQIEKQFKKTKAGIKEMSTTERLEILHDKLRRGREGQFDINYDFIKQQGLSAKDYIAPSSFLFEKSYFMIEDTYYRCLYLNNIASSLSDEFLANLADSEFPLICTLSIQPVAQAKAVKMVKKRLTGMEANKIEAERRAVKSGYSLETISHELKQSLVQAEELLDDMINKNQKMFYTTISFMVSGETIEKLNENCDTIISKARQATCQLQTYDWQQEEAFRITMPMGIPAQKVFTNRALTTDSTAIFIPFSCAEIFQPHGFYYGLNQVSKNLILLNRTTMKTPSGFILGSSGSGKSFAAKREMLNVILQNSTNNILVIDPENEYGDFAMAFGGTVITISASTDNHVNPFDMELDYGLDEEDKSEEIDIESKKKKAISRKSDYIMSLVECMLEGNLAPTQKTMIDDCVKDIYKNYLDRNFDKKYIPTFRHLQSRLDKEKNTEDGKILADSVAYYTRGSMDCFAYKTNINYSNRFVVFRIRDVANQLKQMALLIMLDFIWNRMLSNKQKNIQTYCYVDEIHVLFDNEKTAEFLSQLYKRGRKYGLIITGITQNVSDILRSESARMMIDNSDFVLMLNQSDNDLNLLSSMLKISEEQQKYVSMAEAGSGLLSAEKIIVPFSDDFPNDSFLYPLMSTRFGENDDETVQKIVEKIINQTMAETEEKINQQAINLFSNAIQYAREHNFNEDKINEIIRLGAMAAMKK